MGAFSPTPEEEAFQVEQEKLFVAMLVKEVATPRELDPPPRKLKRPANPTMRWEMLKSDHRPLPGACLD